jgi:hypothetical protein
MIFQTKLKLSFAECFPIKTERRRHLFSLFLLIDGTAIANIKGDSEKT